MTLCPYCGRPLDATQLPPMRARWLRIYNAVSKAGPDGIAAEDLLVRMYAEDEWPTPAGMQVMRVCIHGINKLIGRGPYYQRITGMLRGGYRLVSIREVEDEKKIQQEPNRAARYTDPQA